MKRNRGKLLGTHQPPKVFACGWTASGRLGLGTNLLQHISQPVQINTLDSVHIKSIYAGSAQTYFITDTGKVYVCGWGSSFRLGHGDGENLVTPTLMTGFGDYFIVEVSTPLCGVHGIARSRCGLVFTWGIFLFVSFLL
jgi:alpha-tubulin suppressor-like RCC1 family protein